MDSDNRLLIIGLRVGAILVMGAAVTSLWRLMVWLPWQIDCAITALAVLAFAYTFEHEVTVRIVRRPTGTWDGVPLTQYAIGKSYEVSRTVGDYLVLQGYAVVQGTSQPPDR